MRDETLIGKPHHYTHPERDPKAEKIAQLERQVDALVGLNALLGEMVRGTLDGMLERIEALEEGRAA